MRERELQLPIVSPSENFQDLPIFVKWTDFLKWLLHTTEKFPKKARFTFSDRINNLALSVVEDLVEARYSTNKRLILRAANLRLEKLRMLLRISFESRYLAKDAYKHGMYSLNETGKMLGGWIKQQETKE